MGTTPTYSWPYPESTDPVANGAQDIEDLALAVETTVSGLTRGKILQIVSTTKTDTFTASLAIGASTAITGLTASITPSSATSKVLVLAQVNASAYYNYTESGITILTRGGSPICVGDAAGSRSQGTSGSGFNANAAAWGNTTVSGIPILFLDSPATTSATTYGIDISHTGNGTSDVYVNYPRATTDRADHWRTTSTITVMEVSA